MEVEFNSSIIFEKNYSALHNPKKKIIVNQGSSRSTKTYSIIQCLIIDAIEQKTESVTTFVRKELSTLKVTALRDFLEILKEQGLYNEKNHNKSEYTYKLNKVTFEFQGLDNPTKKRGAKRRLLFVNEANELTLEDWRQLVIRTTGKIFLDYNPSEEFHWIYDNVLTREDCEYIHSTYKDNPFLEDTIVNEIERLQFEDENFWRIYGLGEKGFSTERIYTNWDIVNEFPNSFNETTYGLDFGFNHPTALIETNENENDIYIRELIYKSGLVNSQIIDLMQTLITNKNKYVYADSANPDKIEEIKQAGLNVYEADKSVKDGIDCVKRKRLHIHKDSVNLIKEIKSYSWKVDKSGRILDEPVKFNDDGMDALRYSLYRKETEIRISFV
jgi:phage terminase large subunit